MPKLRKLWFSSVLWQWWLCQSSSFQGLGYVVTSAESDSRAPCCARPHPLTCKAVPLHRDAQTTSLRCCSWTEKKVSCGWRFPGAQESQQIISCMNAQLFINKVLVSCLIECSVGKKEIWQLLLISQKSGWQTPSAPRRKGCSKEDTRQRTLPRQLKHRLHGQGKQWKSLLISSAQRYFRCL